MNATTLLSIIFCFQTLLCTQPSISELCMIGSAEEVLAKLSTENLQLEAQQCFDDAFWTLNYKVLYALPAVYPINPRCILQSEDPKTLEVVNLLYSAKWTWASPQEEIDAKKAFKAVLRAQNADLTDTLMGVAIKGYLRVFKVLVEEEGVNMRFNNDECLWASAYYGHVDIAKYIFDHNAVGQALKEELFRFSCLHGHVKITELVCDSYGFDLNANGLQGMSIAALAGKVNVMEYLIFKGLDPSADRNEVLRIACSKGKLGMVKFLLTQVDPSFPNNLALEEASFNYHPDIIDILLQDSRVYLSLDSEVVNILLRHSSSGKAKLILLKWMTYHLSEVDMSWIPKYRKLILVNPEFAAGLQVVKNNAVAALRSHSLIQIGNFIEAWAAALENCAIRVSGQPIDKIFDLVDMLLSEALRS